MEGWEKDIVPGLKELDSEGGSDDEDGDVDMRVVRPWGDTRFQMINLVEIFLLVCDIHTR